MGIGKRIKERRESLGLTQAQLAEKLGVTNGAIANYENEVSHPKEPILYKLLEALECEPNYLFQDQMKSAGADQEMINLLQEIKDNPELRTLFSLASKATPEEIRKYIDVIRAIRGSNNGDGIC